jgi:hypothetical protein
MKTDSVVKGLIFKKTFIRVTLDCTLTQEELHAIKENNLDKAIIYRRPVPADRKNESMSSPDIYWITCYKLRQPGTIETTFEDAVEAKRYTEELEQSLRNFKEYLDEAMEASGDHDTSFEL